jgi:hypothetical protein
MRPHRVRSRIALTVLILSTSLGVVTGLADTEAAMRSYKRVTADRTYVFIMIAPVTVQEDLRRSTDTEAASVLDIRNRYHRSGLYRNDGSTEALWTVDWYAHEVQVLSDGVHLVRYGPWASSTDQEAVSFFASGVLLRTYAIRDLVDLPFALHSTVSHFFWEDSARLDERRLKYLLTTGDGNRFLFDLRTGQILSQHRPARVIMETVAVAVVLGALLACWLGWSVIRRRMGLRNRRA